MYIFLKKKKSASSPLQQDNYHHIHQRYGEHQLASKSRFALNKDILQIYFFNDINDNHNILKMQTRSNHLMASAPTYRPTGSP